MFEIMRLATGYFLAMVLASCLPSKSSAAVGSLTPESKADFEWFSSLCFPDVKDAPFVDVATGGWSQSGSDPPQAQHALAFLLSTNDNTFTTLDMDLFQHTFTVSATGTEEYKSVGYEKIGLKERAGMLLDYYEKPHEQNVEADLWRRFGERVTERSQVFVLAWACWRQGLDDEAQRLYAAAQKIRKVTGQDDSSLSLRTKLEKDLGLSMMWKAVLDFGVPSISRKELLTKFQSIAKNYPASEYAARARDTAERLSKMIAEDEQHAKSPPKPLGGLPLEERIRELIFQLRDQNGQQWSQPGECDIFLVPNMDTNTPAHQLVNIGYPAVPQLIAALDNPAFTRSVGFHRNFYFSHTVLTVGDCAAAILSRIAGKSFYTRQSTSSYLSSDGDVAQVRKEAQAWWTGFQQKGEKQTLIDATAAGDDASQAHLLCQRYPEAAPTALMRGVSASKNSWSRAALLRMLAPFSGSDVEDFLLHELREGPSLQARASAASVLDDRGNPEATKSMIQAWQDCGAKPLDSESGAGEVMQYLAHCDSPEAIEILGTNFFQRPVGERLQLVENVGRIYGDKKCSDLTSNAVEKFLIAALQDLDETSMSGTMDSKSMNCPRICDMAGFSLTKNWPARYDFDLAASLKIRDRQILECRNIWRRANNLPELPPPPARTIKLDPADANKVTTVEWAEDGVKPDKEFVDHVESLKGKQITASDIVGILTAYTAKPTPGTGGIQMRVRKDEDLTGVSISLRLLAGVAPGRGHAWKSVDQSGSLGQKAILGTFGEMFVDYSQEAGRWDYLTRAANQAIAGAPETPFIISVRMAGAAW
jgi:hypothetical protein